MNDTELRKKKFLRHMAGLGVLGPAARAAQIPRRTVYHWLKTDPAFREAIEDAREDLADELEFALAERAKTRDTTAAIFLLKGLRPVVYRDDFRSRREAADLLSEIDGYMKQLREDERELVLGELREQGLLSAAPETVEGELLDSAETPLLS